MAGKFDGFGDDEDDVLAPKEPQVTSQDPDERKAGRALRIKRRQEALKRAEQPSEETFKEEEPGPIEQATSSAAEELQRLALDGAAKVTNVKVTTDEREVMRRALFSDKMMESMAKIEEEATDAQTQYDAISANWHAMLEIKDPLDIDAAIKEQKGKCEELLEQKDHLIFELKRDLDRMDLGYYEDLEKQDKDIKELSDRIEKQITIMQRAHEKQLYLIERAIDIEREATVDHNNKRWEALYRQRDREEVAHVEYKFEQLEEHKREVEAIMWDHHAKYREAKIELETSIQELQKELEKLKATCIINTEKIGYNYQVLRKREEENVFVRSQQKRKLNKMSDVANALRSKIRKAAEDGAIEEIKADAEIANLMRAMDDLERKCRHFSHVNNYKFSQVWRQAGARCKLLRRRLRGAEAALHAHVLASPPPPPPPGSALAPPSPLARYENEILQKDTGPPEKKEMLDPKDNASVRAKDRLVRHILQLISDNTGFLVEDRLLKLIEKYPPTSRNLCTLDSIFMALEIQAEEDIELMCKIFLNYAFCPICIGMEEHTSDMLEHSTVGIESHEDSHRTSVKDVRGDRGSATRARSSVARSISASTSRSIHVGFRGAESLTPADQLLVAEADEIVHKCGDPKMALCSPESSSDVASSRRRGVTVSAPPPGGASRGGGRYLCPAGHHLEIESMQVLTALNEFMAAFVPPDKRKLYDLLDGVEPPDFATPSRRLTAQDIERYWSQWKTLFPPEKDRFWDGLLGGLDDYLRILQERWRLHGAVRALRGTNAALRRLTHAAAPPGLKGLRGPGGPGGPEGLGGLRGPEGLGGLPDLPPPPRPGRARRGFTASAPDDAPPPYRLPPI